MKVLDQVYLHLPLILLAALSFLLLAWISFISWREHETVAARRTLLLMVTVPLPYLGVLWLPAPWSDLAGWFLLVGTGLLGLLLIFPTGRPRGFADDRPGRPRIDERAIMFSRAELKPGTPRFESYYADHPDHLPGDDNFRSLPGLMAPGSGKYAPLAMAAAAASFKAVEELAGLIEGSVAQQRMDTDPIQVTDFLKGWARKLGAADCRVARLQPEHFYSHKGRGPHYGRPIVDGHAFGLVITVEMGYENLGTAPEGPALMESAQQYMAAGQVAVQLAQFIRELGWPATAHIDGNYEVICPLVARDAGLGEIGRMGLLMTPRLGPRVRLAVVTTDLPLVISPRNFDPTVLHFCSICRKCAEICPPGAIPSGDRQDVHGAPRWLLDDQACFTYWCAAGTDCGQCMRVCPYAHTDSLLHNLVRWGLRRSFLFRHFALKMDNLIYGRRPRPRPGPSWLPPRVAQRPPR